VEGESGFLVGSNGEKKIRFTAIVICKTGVGSMSALNVLASAVSDVIPLRAYRRIIPRELVGFVYHLVSEQAGPHIRHLYSCKTPQMFEQDLSYLSESFALPGYDQLFGDVRSTLEKRAAFVTFDDGLAECSSTVGPMLVKHRVPCIFFLVTECIDNRHMMYRHKISLCISKILDLPPSALISNKVPLASIFLSAAETKEELIRGALSFKEKDSAKIDRLCEALEVDWRSYLERSKPYMTQGQIKDLLRAGFKIGAHTRRHAFLADLTAEEMETEIVGSCNEIREITGDDNVPFAFPFSGAGVGRDFLQHLREKHPVIGPAFDTAGVAIDAPFVFNRITADVPSRGGASGTNIPALLHGAYRSTFLTGLRGIW
jgi:peptidoglycan/xylan/chitin deacetylase (PgdA/CDA1 family)